MKKIFLFLIILFFCGCQNKVVKDYKKPITIPEERDEEHIEEPIYIDDNPIKIAFYRNNNGTYKRVDKFSSHGDKLKEIGVFSIILSNEESMNGSIKKLYNDISSTIPNFSNYKIGFNIKFTLIDDRVVDVNVFKPVDYVSYGFGPYLYAWIYDDINANGWHSHIEEKDFNDSTIMSSIKLMWGNNFDEIKSDIELTVFTYDSDDFDESGNYRGISKFTTIIERS